MTTPANHLLPSRTWRDRVASPWAAYSTRPLPIRVVVTAMFALVAVLTCAALNSAVTALVGFSVAMCHFGFGQPTPAEANLSFLDAVLSKARIAGLTFIAVFVIACAAGFLWSLPQREFRLHLRSLARREFFLALCMFVSTALILAALYFAYQNFAATPLLRTHLCVAAIVAALGCTICLAGAIQYFDRALAASPPRQWFLRWPVKLVKRLVLLAQLATTALALGAAGVLIFDFKIPGTTP